MSPMSVVATGAITAFYTSLVSTIDYIIELKLLWIYALAYNLPCVIVTIYGILILKLIKKKEFYFITIFTTAFIILASIVVLIVIFS